MTRIKEIKDARKEKRTKGTGPEDLKEEEYWPPSQEEIKAARAVLEKVRRVLLRQPGVRAVDIGFRIQEREDRFSGDVAVRAHVENKLTEEFVRGRRGQSIADALVDLKDVNVGRSDEGSRSVTLTPLDPDGKPVGDGVYLDIVEARYLPSNAVQQVVEPILSNDGFDDDRMLDFARSEVHPLVGGVSIGRDVGQAGTLGAIVWDRTDGTPSILSNWHILAGEPSATAGQPCYQPAIFDGGQAADAVAALKRWHFGRYGDAALAELSGNRAYCAGEVLGLWVPIMGVVEPWLGMPVRKYGRTTGYTEGFIDGIDLSINIDYSGTGVQRFDNQVHIAVLEPGQQVSAPGDSGAVWVTKYVPHDPERGNNDGNSVPETHESRGRLQEIWRALQEIQRDVEKLNRRLGKGDLNNRIDPRVAEEENNSRVYYAVALNFAGDVPGAKSGEFAVASRLDDLSERLRFSFRPLFFPESGLVVQRKPVGEPSPPPASNGGPSIRPSGGRGDSAGGPQPTPERVDGGG